VNGTADNGFGANNDVRANAPRSGEWLHVTRILPYSPEQWFALVADFELYPQFLPGWLSATITRREQNRFFATQRLGLPPLSLEFDSVATLEPVQHIHITTSHALFDGLEIDWRFTPVAKNSTCVSLSIYGAQSSHPRYPLLLNALYSPDTVLDYFARQARRIYGQSTLTAAG
jgi:coenzyme Q-binding protein COQ10